MDTYKKGNLCEAMFTARMLEKGYNVLVPVGGGCRYDLVVEFEDGLKKIQVKSARIYKGKVVFNVCSNNKGYSRKSYHGEIDFFGCYCQELKSFYLVPVEKTGNSEFTMRTDDKSVPNSNHVRDYEV